jgi:hypothetical protein
VQLILLLALVLAAPPDTAGPQTPDEWEKHLTSIVTDSRPAAQQALGSLDELASDDNFKSLGFTTLAEVKNAKLGVPFPVVLVRLDKIKNFKEGDDPLLLLHPLHRAVYPLLVNEEFRSALEIRRHDGKWELASIGLTSDVRRYAEGRRRHSTDDPKIAHFLVKVPALHQYYLGHQTDKGLRLLRIREDAPQERLESHPAAEVFLKLVPFAQEHDGKAR